jgi:capsular exopolysaccharide synthesis family protein
VLLVEGDLRRPALCTQMGMPSMPGLLNVLAGQAALDDVLIQVAQFPNLYVLPAGTSPSNPSELLDSSAWSSLRGTLREKFGYTIIDSPPVAAVADYDLLQVACDGVILVVRPDHTNRHDCRKAIESIPKDKLLGVVMNCVKQWFLVRSHGDYSSYYYYRRA